MKFVKGSSKYQLVSDCSRYSIAKVIVNGEVQYEAWHTPEKREAIALAVQQRSALECIGICRRHAGQDPQKKTA